MGAYYLQRGAHLSGRHEMAAITQHFGGHYSTVSRMEEEYEESEKE